MLTTLKAKMRNEVEFKTSLESALEYVSENGDDIKDVFLDDPDAMVIGAENDPDIAKLVDSLPDDVNEEINEITEKDIEDIVEGFVPMSSLLEDVAGSAEDGDAGSEDADGKPAKDMSETDVGEDQEDIEDAPDKDPVKEEFDNINLFDLLEADFDNILADEQDEAEDAPDKDPVKGKPECKNIDGEDQEDIEDAPDKDPVKGTPDQTNIDGEKQEEIEDAPDKAPVKESSDDDDEEFDDDDLDDDDYAYLID